MSENFQELILSLDRLYQELTYINDDTNNTQIKNRLVFIGKEISILINDLEKQDSFNQKKVLNTSVNNKPNTGNKIPNKNQPKKKKHRGHPTIYEGAKGRNSHRSSSLFNSQGGFKPSRPSYHVKAGYED